MEKAVIVDALIAEPELLICDNIIQALDVTVAAQIVRLLRELRGRISAGIVFISTSVPSVAEVADEEEHHPDIDIRYNKVRLLLSTHSKGGLTELDFGLAERIDTLSE